VTASTSTSTVARPRIALLWHQVEDASKARRSRLDGVFRALKALGAVAEAVVYADEVAAITRERVLETDGVLVWVNPITAGRDRSILDAVLRDVAAAGVWVSAHPDVVSTLGTKEVLYRTRSLGWGSNVRLYDDVASLRDELPSRLLSGPVVLKRARGNGGLGVWKVEVAGSGTPPSLASIVHVQHAYDGVTEETNLDSYIESFTAYLEGGGRLVEQPFLPRAVEGMVRCYLSGPAVAGFAEHVPRGFLSPGSVSDEAGDAPALGFEKRMHGRDAASLQGLREVLESDWIPAMQRLLGLDERSLPAVWDADLLRGSKTPGGEDTWVLCEINASCVSPFPDEAAEAIARWTYARIQPRRSVRSA
jgi:glutathione synthase/RimK-type ligase-like ATP-grasp enzyme